MLNLLISAIALISVVIAAGTLFSAGSPIDTSRSRLLVSVPSELATVRLAIQNCHLTNPQGNNGLWLYSSWPRADVWTDVAGLTCPNGSLVWQSGLFPPTGWEYRLSHSHGAEVRYWCPTCSGLAGRLGGTMANNYFRVVLHR